MTCNGKLGNRKLGNGKPGRRLLSALRAALSVAFIAGGGIAPSQAMAQAMVTLDERIALLRAAYPRAIRAVTQSGDGRGSFLVMADGTLIQIDDGVRKSHQQKLRDADIEDMLAQVYPVGRCVRGKPARNFEPGRVRNTRFFRSVYGQSRKGVAAQLVQLDWYGRTLSITRVGGVDAALRAVLADLKRLPGRDQIFVRNTAGTFNWRTIAGTRRLSVHSFGAAIDVDIKYADYWRWAGGKPGDVPNYRNRIPKSVVDVFERHGFIWGGRWYHFDTMHFEYRPALILIGRLAERRGCARFN